MNLKLVIFWIFAIILLGGVGLFGYLNQDLIAVEEPSEYDPSETQSESRTCNATLAKGQSSYKFSETNGVIDRFSVSYTASEEDLDLYTSASNINNVLGNTQNPVNGISSVLYGEMSSFTLLINIDINDYDHLKIEELYNDLINLNMVIDSDTNLENYKSAINGLGIEYTCS